MRSPKTIPLNPMSPLLGGDIYVGYTTADHTFQSQDLPGVMDMARQPHRDDYYLFIVQESGHTVLEIDFQAHTLNGRAILYIHPGQVHRMIAFKNVAAGFLAIRRESVQALYQQALQDIAPAHPMRLSQKQDLLFSESMSLCRKLYQRKQERLGHAMLQDSCNTFIGLVCSRYLERVVPAGRQSRQAVITQAFKALLEKQFLTQKRPSGYAAQLHITTAYLNECVKHTTGHPVSHHIRERVILEARRMLYHSDQSVKEIAATLGYDDYPYFSRLFTAATGMSALTFRAKNRD